MIYIKMQKSLKALSLTILGLLISFSFANTIFAKELPQSFSTEAFWYDGKWAHERSDLPKDPSVSFGRLSNGMRYAIIPHNQPPNRVSLYLNVQVGSLMEEEHEQGFAHFVEHMAFNGSKNFPAGSLIPFFQDNGMSFGGDTNAHTSLHETVYKLNLAKNDKQSIQSGLNILRDFADGILFEEHEVAEEIGVILSEKKVRDSEAARNREERQAFMYPNTVFTQSIIGSEAHIKSANSQNLSAFYNKWYTADRMMLVAVGSVQIKQLESMIKATFSSIEKPNKIEEVQAWGDPKNQGERFRSEKRPIDGTELSLTMHFERVHKHDSKARQEELLITNFINYALDRRLARISEENAGLWTFARSIDRHDSGFLPSVMFVANTTKKNWEKVLEIFAEEKKRMQLFGLTQEELDAAKAYYLNQLNRYAEEFSSMNNSDIASLFVYSANMDKVYTSIEYDKKLYDELAKKIDLNSVNNLAKNVYANDNITVVVGSSNPPSVRNIKKIWTQAKNINVTPYIFKKEGEFPYLPLPELKNINDLPKLEKREIVRVDNKIVNLFSAKLANNIEFYALPLYFTNEGVSVQLIYGNGYSSINDKDIALAKLSSMVMRSSGLGSLSLADTKKISENIGGIAKESFGLEHFEISASGDRDELLALIQTVWTQYKDPKPTEQALVNVKLALQNQEHAKNNTLQGIVKEKGSNYFYGNLARYSSLSYKEASRIQLKSIENFVAQARQSGDIKILVSGDFNINEAYKLIASYFSDIENNSSVITGIKKKISFPTNKKTLLKVKEEIDQATLHAAWYAPMQYSDRKTMATRQLAAAVLRDKLREDIREKMGASYSPSIVYRVPVNENDYAILQIMIPTDNQNLAQVQEYVRDLQAFEVSQELLNRLRLPMFTSLESNKKNNTTWQRLVRSELIYDMPFIEWDKDYRALLESITAKEVTEAINLLLSSPYAEWAIHTVNK